MIPLHEPYINGNEWKYVKECLDTGWVSSVGKYVDLFEQKISEYTGAKYAIACVNGSAALHISLLLAGVQPENEVIVPSLTFIASANVIRYCNAYPVFMDSELEHFNINVDKLEKFLKGECKLTKKGLKNKNTGRIIKAVMPVHILGYPCDIKRICKLAKKYKLKVIEDAAESMGTFLDNKHMGTFGDFGCLSFNGNKIITTGGGGIILTNNKKLAKKAKYLTQQAKQPHKYEYIHNEIGYNYRMTNVIAAIGVAQLEQLEKFIEKKIQIEKWYKKEFKKNKSIYFPESEKNVRWNRWIFSILLKNIKTIEQRNNLIEKLIDNKIAVRPFWLPIHLQKSFKKFYRYELNNVNKIYKKGLHLPSSVSLDYNKVSLIIEKYRVQS